MSVQSWKLTDTKDVMWPIARKPASVRLEQPCSHALSHCQVVYTTRVPKPRELFRGLLADLHQHFAETKAVACDNSSCQCSSTS